MATRECRTLWKPGQSGNPNGRPKRGTTFTDALKAHGTPEELAKIAWDAARKGEPWAIQMIFNRLEPQATRISVETEGNNDGYDLNRLTEDELRQFIDLAGRAVSPADEPIEIGVGATELP